MLLLLVQQHPFNVVVALCSNIMPQTCLSLEDSNLTRAKSITGVASVIRQRKMFALSKLGPGVFAVATSV